MPQTLRPQISWPRKATEKLTLHQASIHYSCSLVAMATLPHPLVLGIHDSLIAWIYADQLQSGPCPACCICSSVVMDLGEAPARVEKSSWSLFVCLYLSRGLLQKNSHIWTRILIEQSKQRWAWEGACFSAEKCHFQQVDENLYLAQLGVSPHAIVSGCSKQVNCKQVPVTLLGICGVLYPTTKWYKDTLSEAAVIHGSFVKIIWGILPWTYTLWNMHWMFGFGIW